MTTGRSVRLYLAEGTPTGIVTAEIVNWTGHVLSAPRSKLNVALNRSELKRTGVYILYGSPLDSDLPVVYVGEGDDISLRLQSHARDDEKDYWERFIAVTNKDMNLTKAHVKYLEGRMIGLLRDAKKCETKNRTEPTFDKLPEADIADMESFLEAIQLVLPVVGVDFFRKATTKMPRETGAESVEKPEFLLVHAGKGINARAREEDGEFVVLEGSYGDLNETVSFSQKLKAFRDQVLESGRAQTLDDGRFRLTEDVAFSSPSAAAVFLFGTSRNGRTDWLVSGTRETYGDWRLRSL
ncbi:hypothetical protein PSM7751_03309 [Pseudooceanicola marinus]|uniref:DUF4357 domain-containing protein n=1 Tax=Pseudooceanicola marinus TaxID=396013 RepID=A0A1X6ZYI8_9RHOB|nr:GIY-YIG nuclease family protein [Pseudooceanicola marinus]PJE30055.1 DUF4357 domain-containing protein [Pseudooceanicola marinus]SLN64863.1 hypothetical protein PSM7751_03309 [Pseudooceanicola marinus]